MTNTYKAISDLGKHYHGEEVAELDLSPTEERDAIDGGHLKIVPRTYKVRSDNYAGGALGETVELALPKELEAALISGSHIERIDSEPDAEADESGEKTKKPRQSTKSAESDAKANEAGEH